MIRKAIPSELNEIVRLYDAVHTAEEAGLTATGWVRGVYPSEKTVQDALNRDDLFILEEDARILAAAVINRLQVDAYAGAPWKHPVPDDRVCVLHTLAVAPAARGRGFARFFLEFYEAYARSVNCPELRIDTNARNEAARAMYRKHGYEEIGIVPTVFNGIPGVDLVLLEKNLG